MSQPMNPAAPAAKPRPASVTISSYLLISYAVLQLINLVAALSTLGKTQDVYRDLYAGTSAEGSESYVAAAGVISAVVGLVLAVGFVVLALLNNRGKNVSRIVTWVIGALGVCCAGLGFAGTALTNSMGTPSGSDMPSPAEVQRRIDEVLPSWYGPLTTTVSVIALLALLAALILLALPASNEFFRKPAATAGWEPPLPGSTYPGQPGPAQQAERGYPPVNPPQNPPAPPPEE